MRRLIGYVDALPADSRTLAVDPKMPWTIDRELLALTVEELSRLSREAPLVIERPEPPDDQSPQAPLTTHRAPTPTRTRTAPKRQEPQAPSLTTTPQGGMVANGFEAMIQLAQARGQVGSSA